MPPKDKEQEILKKWMLNSELGEEYLQELKQTFDPVQEELPAEKAEELAGELNRESEIPEYKIPDEKAVERNRKLRKDAEKAVWDSLLGTGPNEKDENQLWKQIPEGGFYPENIDPLDAALLPFLEPNTPGRQNLLRIYARRQEEPNRAYKLTDEETRQLDSATCRGVERMIQRSRQNLRRVGQMPDAELVGSYAELNRACRLADAVMKNEKRRSVLNEAQQETLQEMQQAGEVLRARMEFIRSPAYPLLDSDAMGKLPAEQKKKLGAAEGPLAPLRNAMEKRTSFGELVQKHEAEEAELASQWETIKKPDIQPNGVDGNDLTKLKRLELIYLQMRDLVTENPNAPEEEKTAKAEKVGRVLKSNTAWLTPEQYRERFGEVLPDFYLLSPADRQIRHDRHERMIEQVTAGALKEMSCFRRGYPNPISRLHQQMFAVLDEENQQKLYDYCDRRSKDAPKKDDPELYQQLIKTAASNMIGRRKELEDALEFTDEQILENYPKVSGLIATCAAADDYLKEVPKGTFTEKEAKALRRLNELGSSYMARVEKMLQPQYEIFEYKDMSKAPLHELMQTQQKLEQLDEVSTAGYDGMQIGLHDTFFLTGSLSKIEHGRAPSVIDRITDAAKKLLEKDPEKPNAEISYCTRDGENLLGTDALQMLDRGEMVFAYHTGVGVVPLYCGEKGTQSKVLVGEEAANALPKTDRKLKSPEPAVPPAQEDPEPEISRLSLFWNNVVSLFTLGRKKSETYQRYEERFDAWSLRQQARDRWENLGEDGQEEALEEYRKQVDAYEALRKGTIPDAVFRKARVDPEKNNLPVNSTNAPLFADTDAEKLMQKVGSAPEGFRENLETLLENAKKGLDESLRECRKTAMDQVTLRGAFRDVLVFSAVKESILSGRLTEEDKKFLSGPDAVEQCKKALNRDGEFKTNYTESRDRKQSIEILTRPDGLKTFTEKVMGAIRIREAQLQKTEPTNEVRKPELTQEKGMTEKQPEIGREK